MIDVTITLKMNPAQLKVIFKKNPVDLGELFKGVTAIPLEYERRDIGTREETGKLSLAVIVQTDVKEL